MLSTTKKLPKKRRIRGYSECYKPISGSVHVNDIEWDQTKESAKIPLAEEFAVCLNQAKEPHLMTPQSDPMAIILNPSLFEIFSFRYEVGGTLKKKWN